MLCLFVHVVSARDLWNFAETVEYIWESTMQNFKVLQDLMFYTTGVLRKSVSKVWHNLPFQLLQDIVYKQIRRQAGGTYF